MQKVSRPWLIYVDIGRYHIPALSVLHPMAAALTSPFPLPLATGAEVLAAGGSSRAVRGSGHRSHGTHVHATPARGGDGALRSHRPTAHPRHGLPLRHLPVPARLAARPARGPHLQQSGGGQVLSQGMGLPGDLCSGQLGAQSSGKQAEAEVGSKWGETRRHCVTSLCSIRVFIMTEVGFCMTP